MIVALDLKEDKIYERVEGRKFDPIEGAFIYPKQEEESDRYLQLERDCHKNLKKRFDTWKKLEGALSGIF